MTKSTALRTSLSIATILCLARCAAPMDEPLDEAPEALRPSRPSAARAAPAHRRLLTRPGELISSAEDEIERWLGARVPHWKVYQSGRDFYYGTSVQEIRRNVKHYYDDPRGLDRFSRLVAIPPGGEGKPDTWLFLGATELWMKGDAYLTDDLGLSMFDALGILLGLRDAGNAPPLLPASPVIAHDGEGESQEALRHVRRIRRIRRGRPPRPPARSDRSFRDVQNGVGPGDRPVGEYPGSDRRARPGEAWETFRCRGAVYEGYRSDCPDFKAVSLGARWASALQALIGRMNEEMQRDPGAIRRNAADCAASCDVVATSPEQVRRLCQSPWSSPYIGGLCVLLGSHDGLAGVAGANARFDAACARWCDTGSWTD